MGEERIDLDPPLPGLATKATITFLSPTQGLLGRSKPVGRAEADRAELVVTFDGRVEERELDLAGVDAYLAEVRAFQARVAAKRAANEAERRTPEEHARVRAERRAAIRPDCPHCGAAREYRGVRHLLTAGNPGGLAYADPAHWGTGMEAVHLYVCPLCGSMAWFAVGPLEHPLGT
ncbi:MAG: hypothetical protein M3527_01940 [Actinomycetota bacterium]|nr:hypothetical protein [Acidimicrobiia bacterium]MDQ3293203.1 hypothetical protein [Actinomycetota bacterium]